MDVTVQRLEMSRVMIREATGSTHVETFLADFASLSQVRDLANNLKTRRLDLLINNAGIGGGKSGEAKRELSQNGYELRFAVNYLAPFLLTHLLLPCLRRAAPARIINVGSVGQSPIDFSDVMLERRY